ncbi:transposase [Streptomyces sp. NPDC048106]|uniref:transposase n=1 Tax=Streptomyces sp. NPDC048106 TaxID=3155750 RepID=UPI00345180B1
MQLSRCPLSLCPRPGEQVRSLSAQIARASNPGGTTVIWVRDRLDGLWNDEDFADWYPRDGRPGLSPARLATVCVLQFLLGLSERQAAEAVRCRIVFKYALAMELADPGFHHSVLSDFRERLAEGDGADRLLDLALVRLKGAGLVGSALHSAPTRPTSWPQCATRPDPRCHAWPRISTLAGGRAHRTRNMTAALCPCVALTAGRPVAARLRTRGL